MYFPRLLLVGLVGCLCLSKTSTEPLEATRVQQLNDFVRKVSRWDLFAVLVRFVVAASGGKHFFRMPEGLSEDCVRTAAVTLDLWERPSSINKTALVFGNATTEFTKDIASHNTSQHPTELLCQLLDAEYRKRPSDFPDYDQLKRNVPLPQPAQNYYVDIEMDPTTAELTANASGDPTDDPTFTKFRRSTFILALNKHNKADIEYIAVSQTIQQLATRQHLRSTVDEAYAKVLDDYVREVFLPNADPAARDFKFNHYPELKKMDEYFSRDPVLKEEYQKAKKQVTDRLVEWKQSKTRVSRK